MERVVSTKAAGLTRVRSAPKGCSQASWHELLNMINSRPDRVLPMMEAVDEVIECHARCTGDTPMQAQRRLLSSLRVPGRKYYSVEKAELFKLVQAHGKVCDHG